MRHFFTRRASGKRRNSQGKDKAENITASPNNSDPTADGDVVVAAVGGGEGEVRRSGGQRRSSSSSNPVPPSPVPDFRAGEEPVSLKDFASQRKVPGFAKVVKGSYMTIGGSRFSFQKQHHDVFIHSVQAGVKVLAHGVKRVESHRRGGETSVRLCPMDQRLTVPMTYQGWFELLSEDGKSARPIRSVPELARASPTRCLVRENVKGYLNTGEGRLTFDKTKAVLAGEQLRLCEVLSLPAPGQGLKVKLLRCVDAKGDEVYLSFDQKGLFTPIAEDDDLVGVFTIRDIIRRFRLPLTVQLVHGVRPKVPDSKFSGLVRLDWVYSEETAFVSPLEKNHVRLLPVPCDVSLQLVAASNQEDMAKSDMFRSLQAKCARMVSNYNNTIHLIVSVPDSVLKRKKTQTRTSGGSNIFSPEQPDTQGFDRRPARRSKSREDLLMDEIDDLYSYVRDGGTPPAKTRFQYNSDEESYWEEPAYEALGEFRARVEAMERGHEVCFPDRYPPADPTRLRGLVGEGGGGGGGGGGGPVRPSSSASGAAAERAEQGVEKCGTGAGVDESKQAVNHSPPPLPPRGTDERVEHGMEKCCTGVVADEHSQPSENYNPPPLPQRGAHEHVTHDVEKCTGNAVDDQPKQAVNHSPPRSPPKGTVERLEHDVDKCTGTAVGEQPKPSVNHSPPRIPPSGSAESAEHDVDKCTGAGVDDQPKQAVNHSPPSTPPKGTDACVEHDPEKCTGGAADDQPKPSVNHSPPLLPPMGTAERVEKCGAGDAAEEQPKQTRIPPKGANANAEHDVEKCRGGAADEQPQQAVNHCPPPSPPKVTVERVEQNMEKCDPGAAALDEQPKPSKNHSPPPLPPKPADLASKAAARNPCPQKPTTVTTNGTKANTTSSSAADADSHKPVLSRRASAPLSHSRSAQVFSDSAANSPVNARATTATHSADSPKKPTEDDDAPNLPHRGRSRSDSEPSLPLPVGHPAAVSSAAVPVLIQSRDSTPDVKPGWTERLRYGFVLPNKDRKGSGSTSSGSGQPSGAQISARDFKDSDISSRAKTASSSSSGERSARKRMQILYL